MRQPLVFQVRNFLAVKVIAHVIVQWSYQLSFQVIKFVCDIQNKAKHDSLPMLYSSH